MDNSWKDYKPAPIEVFHGEALEKFHQVARADHSELGKALGVDVVTINGIQFNQILAEFKTKIMKEYRISNLPIRKEPNG